MGKRAYQMIGKTPSYIEVIRPLSGGVISDDRMTQYMIREFILQVSGHRLTKPRIIICVPSFITDVEKSCRGGSCHECRFTQGVPHR